jgi:hypothetical protein
MPAFGAASPPKREPIVTPQIATYKGGKPDFGFSCFPLLVISNALHCQRESDEVTRTRRELRFIGTYELYRSEVIFNKTSSRSRALT